MRFLIVFALLSVACSREEGQERVKHNAKAKAMDVSASVIMEETSITADIPEAVLNTETVEEAPAEMQDELLLVELTPEVLASPYKCFLTQRNTQPAPGCEDSEG